MRLRRPKLADPLDICHVARAKPRRAHVLGNWGVSTGVSDVPCFALHLIRNQHVRSLDERTSWEHR